MLILSHFIWLQLWWPTFFCLNDIELLNVVYCPKLFDFIYYGINSHGFFADAYICFLIFMFKNKKIHNAKFQYGLKFERLPKCFYCCCYCRIITSSVAFQRRRISRRPTSKTSGKRWSISNRSILTFFFNRK